MENINIDDASCALAFLEKVTSNCDSVQAKVLEEILTQNAETEYLKRHGISKGCKDRESFKSKVPVITYDDIFPDMQRIIDGDSSPILCASPIYSLVISSGTTNGALKLIPITDEDLDRRHLFTVLSKHIKNKYIEGIENGKSIFFITGAKRPKGKSGIQVATIMIAYYTSKQFKSSNPFSSYTSPEEAMFCKDNFQSVYAQLLCGFYQRTLVHCIGTTFASGIIGIMRFLGDHYLEICHDISTGSLSPKITDLPLRARIQENYMRGPDPELADIVSRACSDSNWKGILKKIWPNAKYLELIVTGSMAQYIPSLDYYSDNLPKVSGRYTASEGPFGINLNSLCDPYEVSYTIIPNMAYFEFIPLHSTTSEVVDLANVQLGKEYEIVITNYAGLYRYQVGDILRVTGFHNSTPQFKYIRRKSMVLSIDNESTDELDLQNGVKNIGLLLEPLGTTVVDYTSYADLNTIPGHYVIYLELSTKQCGLDQDLLGQCCLKMEQGLGNIYRLIRGMVFSTIGPLEIRVVKNGTFEKLMNHAISRGASINQYKVPRCV